ncbi:hypothetical protein [Lichenihabitans psoromatis]|uniref:hypothetical protein n=1 Tax=Lichenihabitans psoromatis TaxID=2528642 RepID=UPI001038313A|nr:hypothetical protein [Lichenihabitans psoromatis]
MQLQRSLPTYTAGTITGTIGDTVVYGTGTTWSSTDASGAVTYSVGAYDDLLVSPNRPIKIKSVDSASQLTLVEPLPFGFNPGTAYSIIQNTPSASAAVMGLMQQIAGQGSDKTPDAYRTFDNGVSRLQIGFGSDGTINFLVRPTAGTDADYKTSLVFNPATGAVSAAGLVGGGGGGSFNTVRATVGRPSNGIGTTGDFAIDPINQMIYGPKALSAWPAGISLHGADADPTLLNAATSAASASAGSAATSATNAQASNAGSAAQAQAALGQAQNALTFSNNANASAVAAAGSAGTATTQAGQATASASGAAGSASSAATNKAATDVNVTATAANVATAAAFAAAAGSAALTYDTYAQLAANLTPVNAASAYVVNDATANLGLYVKSGASGAGSWIKKSTTTLPTLDARVATIETGIVVSPYMGVGAYDVVWGVVDDASGNLALGVDSTGAFLGSAPAKLIAGLVTLTAYNTRVGAVETLAGSNATAVTSMSVTLNALTPRVTALEAALPLGQPYMGVGTDVVWGVVDDAGRLALGLDSAANLVGAAAGSLVTATALNTRVSPLEAIAPIATPYMGADNNGGPGDVLAGWVDDSGQLGFGLTRDGRLVGKAADNLRAEAKPVPIVGLGGVAYTKTVNGHATGFVTTGAGEVQVTDGSFDVVAIGTFGTSVKYASARDGTLKLWRVSLNGGTHIKSVDDTIRHVIGYGQSNGTMFGLPGGYTGSLTTAAPRPNRALQWYGGDFPQGTAGAVVQPAALAYFVDLGLTASGAALSQEGNEYGFADVLTAGSPLTYLFSGHSVGGYSYPQLRQGTQPYGNILASVTAAKAQATALGMTYAVDCVTFKHGESDEANPNYYADLIEFERTINTDLKAISGQSAAIPIWITQVANWTALGGTVARSALAQLARHEDQAGLRLVTPTYHLIYNNGPAPGDKIHIPAYGIRCIAEKFGQAKLVGMSWNPLRPVSIVASGATITVSFVGCTGPLQFNLYDATANPNGVSDPSSINAKGFEFFDGAGGSATIASVALSSDATQVIVTLSAAPTAGAQLAYAYTGVANNAGGQNSGPRGCLCDSDPTLPSAIIQAYRVSALGQTAQRAADPLVNWCVVFKKPITLS